VKKKRAVDPEAQQLFLKGRFQWIIWFVPIDPRFDRLREDERFAPLMARFGLPAKVEADG
jgi:hypothetical protein